MIPMFAGILLMAAGGMVLLTGMAIWLTMVMGGDDE